MKMEGKWKWFVIIGMVILLILLTQDISRVSAPVISSKEHSTIDLKKEEKLMKPREEETLGEEVEIETTDSNNEPADDIVEPPSVYEGKEILQDMIKDLVELGLEFDSLGEVPDLKDELDQSDYQLIQETMLHYATNYFYQGNIGDIERIYATYSESGAFTTTFWPEVRHTVIENTSERVVYEYIVFPIYSYQTNKLFNYLGGVVTLTLVRDEDSWLLDDYNFDYDRPLNLTWDEVVVFYRDVLEKGTPEKVDEIKDEWGTYFVFKLDDEYWKIHRDNGEVFEVE